MSQCGAIVPAFARRRRIAWQIDFCQFVRSFLHVSVFAPRAFDFESSHWPSQFHHTCPFHDGKGREKVDFPWERLTGEPLIYASMGTVMNGQVEAFRTIVAALAKHKDLQLVLSVGDRV
jgi:zeaxanthin glucosyltransferase